MLHFDEISLVSELDILPSNARIGFAAAAATRQIVSYERFELNVDSRRRQREIVLELWNAVHSSHFDRATWSAFLDEVMVLLPHEGANRSIWYALAEDAVSSLAYAIRCALNDESREAAWAARRSYEAADQVAIRMLDIELGTPGSEAKILSHEIVQRELSRQQGDLALLRASSVSEVKLRSFDSQFLTNQEADCLVST